ncbi:MAG: VanZ family protein [Planctomycetota bacterium]|nr:VanZ family protein [Planctomycetota bacterium]
MRTVRLLFCVAYAVLLTMLLLVPQPAKLLGLRRIPMLPWGDIGIHFTAFTILTLLVHCLRWPTRVRWPIVAALLAYGLVIESLQVFVPSRSVELLDYLENMLGVAVGTGIYCLARRLIRSSSTSPSEKKL